MLATGQYGKCEVCVKQRRSQPALWNEDQPKTWVVDRKRSGGFRFARLCCYSLKLRITDFNKSSTRGKVEGDHVNRV